MIPKNMVCQWLAAGRGSPGPPVSSTNKTDRHDITEILFKVEFNIITLTHNCVTRNGLIDNKLIWASINELLPIRFKIVHFFFLSTCS